MFDRRVRRGLVGAAAATLLVAGTAVASTTTWTSAAEFSSGSLTSTVVDGDAVVLAGLGTGRPTASIPWWDAAWGERRCVTVTNNDATTLTEYQIVVDLDTATPIAGGRMSATAADLRAVAADGGTLLDLWIEGPIPGPTTRVWVHTDALPPGDSDICLYYDNPAATTVSDPLAPFTYTTPRPLDVAVAADQAGRDLAVTRYVDGNAVSDGTTSTTLAAGGVTVLPGATHTADTVVTATGPLALRGTGSAVDTYVPIAFAGTDLGDGLTSTLTRIRSANPVGPVTAGTTDVVFLADPIEFTLPETGGESRRPLGLATALVGAGGLLWMLALRRRVGARPLPF